MDTHCNVHSTYFTCRVLWMIFTALHAMQTRSSDENSVQICIPYIIATAEHLVDPATYRDLTLQNVCVSLCGSILYFYVNLFLFQSVIFSVWRWACLYTLTEHLFEQPWAPSVAVVAFLRVRHHLRLMPTLFLYEVVFLWTGYRIFASPPMIFVAQTPRLCPFNWLVA